MPDHAGDVDQTAAGPEEGEEELGCGEGAVVVALKGCFDDVEI